MDSSSERPTAPIGLIAGNGRFPFLVLRAARQLGHEVVITAIEGEAFPELESLAAELGSARVTWIQLGQLGRCITVLKDAGVSRAVMAGQVKQDNRPVSGQLLGKDKPESRMHTPAMQHYDWWMTVSKCR